MRLFGHTACAGEKRDADKILIRKLQWKGEFGRFR